MKAVQIVKPNDLRIIDMDKPTIDAKNNVLVKIKAAGICGSDVGIYHGTNAAATYPRVIGHEIVGVVEEVGGNAKKIKVGDRVISSTYMACRTCENCRRGRDTLCENLSGRLGITVDGGFAEYMTVSAKAVYKLADDVDLDHAALAEPLACCVHSIRNARIQLGDDVVVIGAGIMGALHIRLAKMSGARVIVSELDPVRMDVARKMGADIVINANEADPIAQVKEFTEGRGADAVFCTVATSAVAKQAVDMAGKLGRVVMYTSFFPDLPIEISPTKLHSGEQILTGSVNPNPADFLTATRLLSRKLIDVSSLISDRVPMAEIDRAFREAVEPNTYRIIVKP